MTKVVCVIQNPPDLHKRFVFRWIWTFTCIRITCYLQHSRPCCIGYTTSRLRLELVYPIQHGRSCGKYSTYQHYVSALYVWLYFLRFISKQAKSTFVSLCTYIRKRFIFTFSWFSKALFTSRFSGYSLPFMYSENSLSANERQTNTGTFSSSRIFNHSATASVCARLNNKTLETLIKIGVFSQPQTSRPRACRQVCRLRFTFQRQDLLLEGSHLPQSFFLLLNHYKATFKAYKMFLSCLKNYNFGFMWLYSKLVGMELSTYWKKRKIPTCNLRQTQQSGWGLKAA